MRSAVAGVIAQAVSSPLWECTMRVLPSLIPLALVWLAAGCGARTPLAVGDYEPASSAGGAPSIEPLTCRAGTFTTTRAMPAVMFLLDRSQSMSQSFAAGAILTMLASTVFPEAFKDGGPLVGLLTSIGFLLAFFLTQL